MGQKQTMAKMKCYSGRETPGGPFSENRMAPGVGNYEVEKGMNMTQQSVTFGRIGNSTRASLDLNWNKNNIGPSTYNVDDRTFNRTGFKKPDIFFERQKKY